MSIKKEGKKTTAKKPAPSTAKNSKTATKKSTRSRPAKGLISKAKKAAGEILSDVAAGAATGAVSGGIVAVGKFAGIDNKTEAKKPLPKAKSAGKSPDAESAKTTAKPKVAEKAGKKPTPSKAKNTAAKTVKTKK